MTVVVIFTASDISAEAVYENVGVLQYFPNIPVSTDALEGGTVSH